jgi:hypothetical protein
LVDEKDFQKRVQRIGELVDELETIGDPAARTTAKTLMQLLMDMHGRGFERILEIALLAGESGEQIIDDLGRDPLVSSLLILYGIHPEELQTRVERKLLEISSKLHKMGAEATLIGADDGGVRVRVRVDGHACGSTSRTVQGMVEEAVYEAAPDLKTLVLEGLEEPAASGFIAVETLLEASAALAATRSPLSDPAALSGEGMD